MINLTTVKKRWSEAGTGYVLRRIIEYSWLKSGVGTSYYWKLAPKYYNNKYSKTLQQFGLPISPFRMRYVNPKSIYKFSERPGSYFERLNSFGSIEGGEWKERPSRDHFGFEYVQQIDETVLYKSLRRHFMEGVPWKETKLFTNLLDKIDQTGAVWRGSKNKRDLLDRCAQIDHLFQSMKNEGYLKQSEIRERRQYTLSNAGFINERMNEIVVDIGPDGEFLLLDGRHRLCLSKIIGIESIPVQVVTRHVEWAKTVRSRLKTDQKNSNIHPDINPIVQ